MRRYIAFQIAALVLILFVACGSDPDTATQQPGKKLTDGQPDFMKEGELIFKNAAGQDVVKIDIEIADNAAEQQRGLMNRSFLRNDQGMLFIFDADRPQSFWMKNTIIPLDIIYVNSALRIVSISENTQPYSEAPIPSKGPAQYVVEVNAGFSAQYGLREGDAVLYTRM